MKDIDFERLKSNNYVRVAKPNTDYWVDFSRAKLYSDYIDKFGYLFNIILYPKTDNNTDFYVIPFFQLRDLFKDEFLAKDKTRKDGSRRWVVTVKDHKFKVSNCSISIDVKPYFSYISQATFPNFLTISDKDIEAYDQEISGFEGGKKSKLINFYERVPKLRADAIRIHGVICKGCKFDFYKIYGPHGENYIEVHHLVPLSSLVEVTLINPKTDMTVLCANCHRMIHRNKKSCLSLPQLKKIIKQAKL